jgi:hypothetical protein
MLEEKEEMPTHKMKKQQGTKKPQTVEQVMAKYEEALRVRRREMNELVFEPFHGQNWIIEDLIAQNDFRDTDFMQIPANPERIRAKIEKNKGLLEPGEEEFKQEINRSKWEPLRPLRSLREVVSGDLLMDLQEKMNDLKRTQKRIKAEERILREDKVKCLKLGVDVENIEEQK